MAELFLVEKKPAGGIADAAERERALDTTRSFVVEAPAGSGKTGLLIQRFLKLLALPSVEDPAEVLAITFTRKATAEMRDRVFRALKEAAAGTEPADGFDRATRPLAEAVLRKESWNLLADPRRLNIRTIDSVCADIARGLPVLSGSGGGLAPTEDGGALYAEAARRTLMLLGGEDGALSAALEHVLLHRDGNLANCEALIADMLAWREQWGELVPLARAELSDEFLDGTVLARLDRALDLAICRALTQLTKVMPAGVLDRLCGLAAEMAAADGYDGGSSPVALCRGRQMAPEEKAAHLEHWSALIGLLLTKGGDFRAARGITGKNMAFLIEPHHKAELIAILDELRPDSGLRDALCRIRALPPAEYPRAEWPTAKALFRVLSRALVELQMVFAARRECDFTEAALQAKSALRREGALDDLRFAANLHLQHLLVDEMQDTSSGQYELIQLLTQRWDGGSQTVFLVGDPKQSIYLFRQARMERFVHTMMREELGDVPVEALHLTANFRSQGELVRAFNETFPLVFPAEPDGTRPELVPYRKASAIRPAGAGAGLVWHAAALPYLADKDECAESMRAEVRGQAGEICGLIRGWQARAENCRIAVLVRNRKHLFEVVEALKEAGILYRAVNIDPLAERQEILDLLALTRALLHPADRTAWLALLRTPWCGLTLADLHALAGGDDPAFAEATVFELMGERGDLLSADGIARLEPFWAVMAAALGQRGRLTLARWVERTWRSFDAHLYAAPEELENASRYFGLLEELERGAGGAQGEVDLAVLTGRLGKLYAAAATVAGAVDLSTIHTSKGLEWDVVFVPALDRIGRGSAGRLLAWLETDAGNELTDDSVAHGILAPIQGKGEATQQLNTWMRSVEKARAEAELSRLFYVACTRAREELHLFAAVARNSKGELKAKAGTLLAAAWEAAGPHFVEGVAEDARAPLALAAGTDGGREILRIPVGLVPVGEAPAFAAGLFSRPEGSFAARSFGNAMHAFLEVLATRMAGGASAEELVGELPEWMGRIRAVLRSSGLAAGLVDRYAARVARGLANTLGSEEGRWVLAAHRGAESESALTTPGVSLRVDRMFLAGDAVGSVGESHLWIVDYKTATHGKGELEEFLRKEEATYSGQLQAYAEQLEINGKPVRLALFYPLLPHLHLVGAE